VFSETEQGGGHGKNSLQNHAQQRVHRMHVEVHTVADKAQRGSVLDAIASDMAHSLP